MNLKSLIKGLLPNNILNFANYIRFVLNTFKMYRYDAIRYRKYSNSIH